MFQNIMNMIEAIDSLLTKSSPNWMIWYHLLLLKVSEMFIFYAKEALTFSATFFYAAKVKIIKIKKGFPWG